MQKQQYLPKKNPTGAKIRRRQVVFSFVLLSVGVLLWSGCGIQDLAPTENRHLRSAAVQTSPESCGLPFTPASHPSASKSILPDDLGTLTSAMACGPGSKQEPDPLSFTTSPEAYAKYVGQTQCSPTAKPGMKAFRDLILKTYPCTGDYGISRSCSRGGQSEHKEGRAWDWKLNYPHPAADAVIKWLLQTRNGVPHAYVRRLGLMYMIWNRKMWRAYQPTKGWQKYTGSSAHTDHIHFSFSRAGGSGSTSFWKGEIQAPSSLHATLVSKGATQTRPASGGASHSLCPGQAFSFYYKVQNSGNVEWTDVNQNKPGKAVRLAFKGGETFSAPSRMSVNQTASSTVKAGATVTFTMQGKAPSTSGLFKTEWQMVSELVQWFGPVMSQNFYVTSNPPGAGDSCVMSGQGGNCGKGVMRCTSKGLVCVGASSSEEKCDNKDNDCNGQIDDGLTRVCYSSAPSTQDTGRCRSGKETCQAGQWGVCVGEKGPSTQEICGNTVDDNCNGQTDEGCGDTGCEDKDGDGYGFGKGCPGEQDCDDSNKSIYPGAPEICDNGKDDDCRGGDRPCQNKTKEDADAGTTAPDSCTQPPCGTTQLDPKQPPVTPKQSPQFHPRGSGCACSLSSENPRPPSFGWFWVLVCCGFVFRRR